MSGCEDDVALFPLPAAGIASIDCNCTLALPDAYGAPIACTGFSLVAVDDYLQRHSTTVQVTLSDTTAPTIVSHENAGPTCLWAPAHDLVVLRIDRDLRAVIDEACDPSPVLLITGATSSEHDDGLGDGSTSDDVTVFPDRVCLRAERSGLAEDGRHYFIELAARDASGNVSAPVLEVVAAPHEQRPDTRCQRLVEVEEAAPGDPACIAEPASPAAPGEDAPEPQPVRAEARERSPRAPPAGCAHAPDGAFLVLTLLLLQRRR